MATLATKKVSKQSKPIVVLTVLSGYTGVIQIQKCPIWLFLPPHHDKLPMKSYISQLKMKADACQRNTSSKTSFEQIRKSEPVKAQIKRWRFNLPAGSHYRQFSIIEVASTCNGKFRDKPALREIAFSLRALRWTQVREWKNLSNNRRMWRPPEKS
jgi:hypothetical protein